MSMFDMNFYSQLFGPNKHILINDAGIGTNRLVKSNNYLNDYNYYYKNMIKMHKIRELKTIERKQNLEKFKKDIIVPGLTFSSAYYKYTGNDYEYFENDKSNATFKKAKINYIQDLLLNKDNKINYKLDLKNNKNENEKNIYKTLKISKNKLLNSKNKTTNNNNKIFNSDDDNDFIYSRTNNNIFKAKNIKCRILFGKTLRDDLEFQKMHKNKKRNLSHYTNGRYQSLNERLCNLNTKSPQMKSLKRNKFLPLIKSN